MAINNPAFSTSDNAAEAQAWRIEMLASPPDISPGADLFDPPRTPNRMYGWYNGMTDMVELYVVNSSGTRYLRVSTYSG